MQKEDFLQQIFHIALCDIKPHLAPNTHYMEFQVHWLPAAATKDWIGACQSAMVQNVS